MPFQQPTSTTIRSFHFRGNAYAFSVESVLAPGDTVGPLRIEASPGYLLTAPLHTTPQAQLLLNFTTEADGNAVVRTTVTLLANGPLPDNGTVTLRDPTGDVRTLHITVRPLLILSDSVLTFSKAQLIDDGDCTAILKISQQGAATPIDLATDDPGRFALAASGKTLNFAPALTVTPAMGSTYVYIRYAPNQPGQHTASLSVKTPYDSQTVTLKGYAGKLAGWRHLSDWPGVWKSQAEWLRQAVASLRRPAHLLVLLLALGLLYTGYAFRCQLIPRFCQSQGVAASVGAYPDTALVDTDNFTAEVLEQRFKNRLLRRVSHKNLTDTYKRFVEQRCKATPHLPIKQTMPYHRLPIKQAKPYQRLTPKDPWVNLGTLPVAGAESDLEKALNKKTTGRHPLRSVKIDSIYRAGSWQRLHPGKAVGGATNFQIHG